MKLYRDKWRKPWEIWKHWHGRYKKRYVYVNYDKVTDAWYFVVRDNVDIGFNSLVHGIKFTTKEEASDGAVKWIDSRR